MVGKGFAVVEVAKYFHHIDTPAYHIGFNEDLIVCCNDYIQPKGYI